MISSGHVRSVTGEIHWSSPRSSGGITPRISSTSICGTKPRHMLLKNDCIQRRSEIGYAAKKRIAHARPRWAPSVPVGFLALTLASLAGAIKFHAGSTGHVFPVQLPWLRSRKSRRMVADRPSSDLSCVRQGSNRSGADGAGRRGIQVGFSSSVCLPGLRAQLRHKAGTHRAEDPLQWLHGRCEGAGGQFVPRRVRVACCAQRTLRQQPRDRSCNRAYQRRQAAGRS